MADFLLGLWPYLREAFVLCVSTCYICLSKFHTCRWNRREGLNVSNFVGGASRAILSTSQNTRPLKYQIFHQPLTQCAKFNNFSEHGKGLKNCDYFERKIIIIIKAASSDERARAPLRASGVLADANRRVRAQWNRNSDARRRLPQYSTTNGVMKGGMGNVAFQFFHHFLCPLCGAERTRAKNALCCFSSSVDHTM